MTELEKINALTKMNINQVLQKLKDGKVQTVQEHKAIQDILEKARVALEKEAYEAEAYEEAEEIVAPRQEPLILASDDIDDLFGE